MKDIDIRRQLLENGNLKSMHNVTATAFRKTLKKQQAQELHPVETPKKEKKIKGKK